MFGEESNASEHGANGRHGFLQSWFGGSSSRLRPAGFRWRCSVGCTRSLMRHIDRSCNRGRRSLRRKAILRAPRWVSSLSAQLKIVLPWCRGPQARCDLYYGSKHLHRHRRQPSTQRRPQSWRSSKGSTVPVSFSRRARRSHLVHVGHPAHPYPRNPRAVFRRLALDRCAPRERRHERWRTVPDPSEGS